MEKSVPWLTEEQLVALSNGPKRDHSVPVVVKRVHYDANGEVIPESEPRTGRRRKYPWDEWKDGEWHTLTKGEDFDIPLEHFRSACYMHAVRYNMQVMTELVSREDGMIALCFIDEPPKRREKPSTVKKAGPASDYRVI